MSSQGKLPQEGCRKETEMGRKTPPAASRRMPSLPCLSAMPGNGRELALKERARSFLSLLFFSPQKNFFSLHSLRRLNGKTTCNHPQERLSYPLSGEDDGKKTPSGQQAVFLFSPGKVSLLPREILLIFSWRSIRADILKKRQESNAASITDI